MLGPLLWDIMCDDVLRLLLGGDAIMVGFAGDLSMLAVTGSKEDLMAYKNQNLLKIADGCGKTA